MQMFILLVSLLTSFMVQAIESFKLDNGLQLIVEHDARSPIVVSQVWYKVGSAYEYNGITGISHALEHMMFKGTLKFPAGVLNKTIADLGGTQNAFTNYDFTAYYQILPKENLEQIFLLESDRMQHLLLDEQEFAKELQVVIEERLVRVDDRPEALARERFLAMAFPGSPYQHPVIGWPGDLHDLNVAKLRDWYNSWYSPANAVLVIVGDVNSKEVLALAEKYFAKIPNPKTNKYLLNTVNSKISTPIVGKREININLPNVAVPYLFMGYNVPSLHLATNKKQAYALSFITELLDFGMASRLQQELVQNKKLAADISVYYDPYSLYGTLFNIRATPMEHVDLKTLEQAILEQLELLINDNVTAEEISRVKNQLKASYVFEKDSMLNKAYALGALMAAGYDWQEQDYFISAMMDITAQDLREVAAEFFNSENLTVAYLNRSEHNV